MKLKRLLENIFSIKNEYTQNNKIKVISILGFRFKKSSEKNCVNTSTTIDYNSYNNEYYKIEDNELKFSSAENIIDVIQKYYKPDSVIDFGCGNGIFLKSWQQKGVKKILGLDVNNIDDKNLFINRENFESVNFENYKNESSEKYGLAMSCEVAEHISEEKANDFIKNLCSFSDYILFSAAIPYQDGLNHINCQPLLYWVNKFKENGYDCYDFIRPQLFEKHEQILSWYIQNILFFVKRDVDNNFPSKTDNPLMFYHYSRVETIIKQIKSNKNYFERV